MYKTSQDNFEVDCTVVRPRNVSRAKLCAHNTHTGKRAPDTRANSAWSSFAVGLCDERVSANISFPIERKPVPSKKVNEVADDGTANNKPRTSEFSF